MPRSADGNFSLPENSLVSNGQEVLPPQHNVPLQDIASAITGSLSRDGRGGMRNNLDMNGFRIQGASPGVAPNDYATLSQVQGATGSPVGSGMLWFTDVAPTGYLICAGQSLSRTQYPALFTVLGTLYGAPSGSTFRLPDMRGRVPACADIATDGVFADRLTSVDSRTLGAAGGQQSVGLSLNQIPSHAHGGATSINGNHSHTTTGFLASSGPGPMGAGLESGTMGAGFATSTAGNHSHTIAAEGGGQHHANVQPTIITNYIIKAF